MMKKTRVGILFGGKSAEHEISLLSAKSIVEALDKDKYEPVLIGIHKSGEWFLHENDMQQALLHSEDAKHIRLDYGKENVTLVPKSAGYALINPADTRFNCPLDVMFPILHGTNGEDGTIQGLLKLMNIPFVGAGVLGSAVGMDKDVMKRLLRDAGIPVAPFLSFTRTSFKNTSFKEIKETLGLPFFVKPANLGSSIGISKIKYESEFQEKIESAFQYDHKIILEGCIVGREIECSVLGNEHPIISLPGELIPQHEFYSYEAKYLDAQGALFEIPAKLTEEQVQNVQAIALKTYQALCCEGMARVDVFLQKDGQVVVNEINTIPGFTRISMYPKLWEVSGLAYPDLIDRLIELALERFARDQQLKTTMCLPATVDTPVLSA